MDDQYTLDDDDEQPDYTENFLVNPTSFTNTQQSDLKLKPDHHKRPLYITSEAKIYLEAFNKLYEHARDFLVAIAEPLCRPQFIHEFELTGYSLYTAVSIGLQTEEIIKYLDLLCKTNLPDGIAEFIKKCTISKGKVSMMVRNNAYHLSSTDDEIIGKLLRNPEIQQCRDYRLQAEINKASLEAEEQDNKSKNIMDLLDELDNAELENGENSKASRRKQPVSFPILREKLEKVQQICLEMEDVGPLLSEYDFRNHKQIPDVKIELRSNAVLRPYQEKSLRKMFGNGMAKSGLIVLPCGAGKTLCGVTAVTTMRKPCIVLCTSSYAVEQWAYQFKLWTTATDDMIAKFTSDQKSQPNSKIKIVISTYSMIAYSGTRAKEGEQVMDWIRNQEWGIMVLDEVHTIPAQNFRKVLSEVPCHCKLGLTATLVREDGKQTDLYFLVGPKLYEANWLELQRDGHIARVQCAEVWCPMTAEYYRQYLAESNNAAKQRLLYGMNPNKVRSTHYLIKYHEERGDKIIVFGDLIYALLKYSNAFKREIIYGGTHATERLRIFEKFKRDPKCQTIFISKVGDNSIDLPDANVLIQIASHGGSRRQEAQRLGRILRAKKNSAAALAISGSDYYNAYFYTLVSKDTKEILFSVKRQRFLVNQGYSFKIVTNLPNIDKEKDLYLTNKSDQLKILDEIRTAEDNDGGLELDPKEVEKFKKMGFSEKLAYKQVYEHEIKAKRAKMEEKAAQASNRPKNELFKRYAGHRK